MSLIVVIEDDTF